MAKPVLATVSLAGCFGCHMSLLDMDDRLLALLEVVEFDRTPFNDIKSFSRPVDIGLIEGGCCNTENVAILQAFRQHCRVLVAVGECAIMGGLPALRNTLPVSACLAEAYLDGPTTWNPEKVLPVDAELPVLLNKVVPIRDVVQVDYFLPGCPPSADLIAEALDAILHRRPVHLSTIQLKYD